LTAQNERVDRNCPHPHLMKLIFVNFFAIEHPFVRGVLDCRNVNTASGCQHLLVATENSVQEAMQIISSHSSIADDEAESFRVPPLMLC